MTDKMIEYIDKNELCKNIEKHICAWCNNYCGGAYCNQCATCKVSLVHSIIALSTPYEYLKSSMKQIDTDANG